MARVPQAKDKTGGTPDGGRMEPGSEGRGGCRLQRRPEILVQKISKEMTKLEQQAIIVAEHLGHEPSVWRIEKDGNSGQIKCSKCNQRAGFALSPMKGKEQVNGDAVENRCPA